MSVLGWVGSFVVAILSFLILWFIIKHIPAIASLGWGGAVTVVAIGYIIFIGATSSQSPAAIVPVIDRGYVDLKGQVGESHMAADLIKMFGGDEKTASSLGITGQTTDQSQTTGQAVNGTIEDQQATVTEVSPNALLGPANGNQTVASTTSGWPVSVIFLAGASSWNPADNTYTDIGGTTQMICGWSTDHSNFITLCSDGRIVSYLMTTPETRSALPAEPTASTSTNTGDLNAAKGKCWLKWAAINLQAEAKWGTNALPTDSGSWTLKGPGEWASFWLGTGPLGGNVEVWRLSNPTIGVSDYPINGTIGRSFPGADDNHTVIVYGTNPDIWSWCVNNP